MSHFIYMVHIIKCKVSETKRSFRAIFKEGSEGTQAEVMWLMGGSEGGKWRWGWVSCIAGMQEVSSGKCWCCAGKASPHLSSLRPCSTVRWAQAPNTERTRSDGWRLKVEVSVAVFHVQMWLNLLFFTFEITGEIKLTGGFRWIFQGRTVCDEVAWTSCR